MKKIACALTALVFASCSPKGFEAVSVQMQKNCSVNKGSIKKQFAHKTRMQLYQENKLSFVNLQTDTLYFIHTYNIESGNYSASIWNSAGRYDYHFINGHLVQDATSHFSPKTLQLVSQWNTAAIREEAQSSPKLIHERINTAYRVIISGGKERVDCIEFRNLYNPKKDASGN